MDTTEVNEFFKQFKEIFSGTDVAGAIQRAIIWGTIITTIYIAYLFWVSPAGSPYWTLRRGRRLAAETDRVCHEAAELEGRVQGLRTHYELLIGRAPVEPSSEFRAGGAGSNSSIGKPPPLTHRAAPSRPPSTT